MVVEGPAGPNFFGFGGSLELKGSPDTEVLILLGAGMTLICSGSHFASAIGLAKAHWGKSIGISTGQI